MVNNLAIIGIVASVLGVIGIVFGLVVGLVVIPAALESGIEEGLVLTDEETDDDAYARFVKSPKDLEIEDIEYVPYFRGHAAFVVTNPDAFALGTQKANLDLVGPIYTQQFSEKDSMVLSDSQKPSFDKESGVWTYFETTTYEFNKAAQDFTKDNCIAGTCEEDTEVTYFNYGISNVLYPIAQQLDAEIDGVPAAGIAISTGLIGIFDGALNQGDKTAEIAQLFSTPTNLLTDAWYTDTLNMRSGVGEAELKIYLGGLIADGAHDNLVTFINTLLLGASFDFFTVGFAPSLGGRGAEVFEASVGDQTTDLTINSAILAPVAGVGGFPFDGTYTAGDIPVEGYTLMFLYAVQNAIDFLELKTADTTNLATINPLRATYATNFDISSLDKTVLNGARNPALFNSDYEEYRDDCITVFDSLKLGFGTFLDDLNASYELADFEDTDFFILASAINAEKVSLYAADLNGPFVPSSNPPNAADVQVGDAVNRFDAIRRLLTCPAAASTLVPVNFLSTQDCLAGDSGAEIAEADTVLDLISLQHSRLSMTRSATVMGAIQALLLGNDAGWAADPVNNVYGLSVVEVASLLDMTYSTAGAGLAAATQNPFQLEIILSSIDDSADPDFTVLGSVLGKVRGPNSVNGASAGNPGITSLLDTQLTNECVQAALYGNGVSGTGSGAVTDLGLYVGSSAEPKSTLIPSTTDPRGSGFANLFVEAALYSNIYNEFEINFASQVADGSFPLDLNAAQLGGVINAVMPGYDDTYTTRTTPAAVQTINAPLGYPQSLAGAIDFFPCSGQGDYFGKWGASFIKGFIDPTVLASYTASSSGSPLLVKTTLREMSFGYTEPLVRLLSCDLSGECSEACVGTETVRPSWRIGITNNFPKLVTNNAVETGLNDLRRFDNWALNNGRTTIPPRTGLTETEMGAARFGTFSAYAIAAGQAALLAIPFEYCDRDTDTAIRGLYQALGADPTTAPQGCGWVGIEEIITDGKGGKGIGPEWNTYGYTFRQAWNDHEGLTQIGTFDDSVADAAERGDRKAFNYYSSLLYRTSPLENKKAVENKYDIKLDYYSLPVDQLQINSVFGATAAASGVSTIYPDMLDIYFVSGLKNLYCQPFYFGMSASTKALYTNQFMNFGQDINGDDLAYFVPDADVHEIHIDVEPFTGAGMGGYLRLQANFYFPSNTFNAIPYLNDAANGILSITSYGMQGDDIIGSIVDDASTTNVDESGYVAPALFAVETTEISEYFAGRFNDLVIGTQDLGDNIAFGGVVAGALFLVNGGLLLAYNLSKTGSLMGGNGQGLAKRDSLAANLV